MMPTCLFCQGQFDNMKDVCKDFVNDGRYYVFECKPCNSIQGFCNGQLKTYWFHSLNGKFQLLFSSDFSQFQLFQAKPHRVLLLQLDFLPNLTPQNVTEERLKLYMVFS